MASKIVIVLILSCISLQLSTCSAIDENSQENALSEIYKLKDIIAKTRSNEQATFENSYNVLRYYLDEAVKLHQDMVDKGNRQISSLVQLIEETANKTNIDISTCSKKSQDLVLQGTNLLETVTKCYVIADTSCVAIRELVGTTLKSYNKEISNLERELRRCKDNQCFTNIIEKAKVLQTTLPSEIKGTVKVPINYMVYLKENMSYCYMMPQIKFVESLKTVFDDIKKCASEILLP